MYSSEDLERFYFQYQAEALPHGESVQSFCLRKKVPYNIYQKWYKDTHNKIVEEKVDGLPSDARLAPQSPESGCLVDTPTEEIGCLSGKAWRRMSS